MIDAVDGILLAQIRNQSVEHIVKILFEDILEVAAAKEVERKCAHIIEASSRSVMV